ncbi:MAG: alpha/beta hydrolase, partial [Caldilineae bacterium]
MFEHKYAEVNGLRLHYVCAGEGELILFAHGFPEFWYAWRRQLQEFGRDHRAVALDMRGYNLSDKPTAVDQYRVKYLVEDLRALAEHLGYRQFTLVGHDWGGAAAWMFAIVHPQFLKRLVIINAPHPAIFARELQNNPAQREASAYMLLLQSPEAEAKLAADNYALLRGLAFGEGFGRGFFTDADRRAYLEAWSQPGALTGGLNYYR